MRRIINMVDGNPHLSHFRAHHAVTGFDKQVNVEVGAVGYDNRMTFAQDQFELAVLLNHRKAFRHAWRIA